ncbi:hypothetical protein LTR36_010735 [Oleoguttula mirabilis]|uniref:Uncharacterized protein n=1 Tax=Oleoguttula mirabilis TaxID=1507867 RepID=A0AAV9JRE2_9PEZI|nr:hypothetical protein LTR36_010735 [Oleoguttula mirabilis]
MALLQYYNYDGAGKMLSENYWYSQAVRLPPNRVECAGQGGWDPENGALRATAVEQIDQAFANVALTLKTAGVKGGFTQVHSVKSYHVPLDNQAMEAMVRNLKHWMPEHKPIWTVIAVPRLALEDMKVEIDVVAFDG